MRHTPVVTIDSVIIIKQMIGRRMHCQSNERIRMNRLQIYSLSDVMKYHLDKHDEDAGKKVIGIQLDCHKKNAYENVFFKKPDGNSRQEIRKKVTVTFCVAVFVARNISHTMIQSRKMMSQIFQECLNYIASKQVEIW